MKLFKVFLCVFAFSPLSPTYAKKYKDKAISYRGPVHKVLAMLNPHFGGWDDDDEVVPVPIPAVIVPPPPLVPDEPNDEALSDSDFEDSDDEFDDLPYQPLSPLPGIIAVALGTR